MTLRDQLVAVADAFCEGRKITRPTLSTMVLNAGHRLDSIARGESDLATGTFEKAMRWFSEHWPEESTWPAGILRPTAETAA